MVAGMVRAPTTTEFSSTAEPAPIRVNAPADRTTAPCATIAPSPTAVAPTIAADDAMSGSLTRRTSGGVE
jgi:hypothetical protein